MKKTGFVIGSIETILGLIFLMITSLIQQVIPKIAKICFMFNNGRFAESEYIINTKFCNAIAICLCLVGVLTIIYYAYNTGLRTGFWGYSN